MLHRTTNMLGAFAGAVLDRLAQARTHPNQTDSSMAALNLIDTFDGCSNRELSQALGLSHSATVRLLDKLTQAGLVLRSPGEDKRSVSLSLTPNGRARVTDILQARGSALDEVVAALSTEQLEQLDGLLDALLSAATTSPRAAAHLCRLCDHVKCPPETCPVHQRALHLLPQEAP